MSPKKETTWCLKIAFKDFLAFLFMIAFIVIVAIRPAHVLVRFLPS
jgi:hypothetical protein